MNSDKAINLLALSLSIFCLCLPPKKVNSQLLYNTEQDDRCRYLDEQDINRLLSFVKSFETSKIPLNSFAVDIVKRLEILESKVCGKNMTYFQQSCYFLSLEKQTWTQSQKSCTLYGGMLAEIETSEENDFIVQTIFKPYVGDGPYVWIGASDIKEEGTFVWNSIGLPLKFSYWKSGEPNDLTGNEDCVHAYVGEGGRWNDRACTDVYRFLCEIKIT